MNHTETFEVLVPLSTDGCWQGDRLPETDGVGECGMCDVCLRKRDDADVEQAVRQAIAGGRMTIGDLCATLADHNYIGVEGVVREMLDRGELKLDRNLFLSLS